MPMYTVTMWLTCNSDDTDILKAFDARWTGSLQRAWSMMLVNATDASDLAVALNGEIYGSCKVQIGLDIKKTPGTDFDGIDAFKAGSWHPGSGGLHESNPVKIVTTKAGTSVAMWTFPADNGKQGQMSAACEWKIAKVINTAQSGGK